MKFNCVISDTTLGGHKALFGLLREQNDGTGQHIFVVPDRYTLGVEKEICETLYPDGAFNVDVCSFTRLAQKALGKKNKACLSKEGTVLLLNRVLSELGDKLVYYKNVKSVAFSREMFASLAAIRSSGITSEELEEKSKSIEGGVGEKLRDMAVIYRAYETALSGRYYDTVTRVDWLVNHIGEADYVRNSHIYVLGFNVFSNAQMEFIKRAAAVCPSVSAAFCDGEGNPNAECFPTRQREELLAYMRASGVPVEIRRSTEVLAPVFDFLHRNVFGSGNDVYNRDVKGAVRISAETNAYEEIKSIAREIRHLVFEEGYRYKEIAVAANNADLNAIASKTFTRYDIPYFIDEKYEVKRGFFAGFVNKVFACVGSGMDIRDVMSFVRHPYSGFCRSEIQNFENYCLKYNVNYSVFLRPFVSGEYEEAEKVRSRVVSFTGQVPVCASAADYCALIENWAESETVEEGGKRFADGSSTEERVYADKEKYLGVIAEIKTLCRSSEMSVDEFTGMLDAVLENMTVSVIPQYMDAVFVGNVSESRFNDVKILFVAGANDGFFPITTGDKLVIGCYDTEVMRRNGLNVFPSPEETNYFEQFAVTDLISKPERLYVTYSVNATDGSALSAGSAVREIRYRLSLSEKPFVDYHGLSEEEKLLYRLATPGNCLYEYMAGEIPEEYAAWARDFLVSEGLLAENDGADENADLLTGYPKNAFGEYKLSVSKMETYFKCPFRNYLTNVLGLKEREEGDLQVNDKGNIIHAVLEKYFSAGAELRKMSENARREYAEQCADSVIFSPEYRRFETNPLAEKELDGIRKECAAVLGALTDNMLNSRFTPVATEKRFGEGRELTVSADGKEFCFYGFIDRVDEYDGKILIVDYKTGKVDDKLTAVYTGEKIQLYVYLKYFMDKGYVPAGVFYLPIADGYGSKPKGYAMKGQMINDVETFKDIDCRLSRAQTGRFNSPNVSFAANVKDGEIGFANINSANLIGKEDFGAIADYVMKLCGRALEEIADGEAEKKPLRDACEYCQYLKICGDVSPRKKTAADAASFYTDLGTDAEGEQNEVE